jgi:hypothetical protein
MAAGLSYLAAKAAEYTATLDWIVSQFASTPTLASNHPHLEQQLSRRVTDARTRITQLRTIVQLNVPALVPRGVSVINELQLDIYVLSENYLPTLQKETASEAEFGRVATKAAQRCGLTDVQEILVSLSGGHAVLSAMLGCPLMFAPPHQRYTLIDLPAMYHEFGHVVFNARREVCDGLARVCADYFRTLDQAGGFINPMEREERRRQINQARSYWTMRRLAEIFCDIFAAYTTGLAYYYLCVDLGMRFGDDPYEINIMDVHPPTAARVLVCKKVLSTGQLSSDVGQTASALWDEHLQSRASSSEFRLWCGDSLLEGMVTEAISSLSRLGAFRRYTGTGHHPQIAPSPEVNLEELLNESVRMLLRDPGKYANWERPYVEALFQ